MNSITRSKAGAVRTVLGAAIAVLLLLQTTGFALAAGITGTISGTLTNAATGAALSGVKLMNSTDLVDHLRAVARLDQATPLYEEYYRQREQPGRRAHSHALAPSPRHCAPRLDPSARRNRRRGVHRGSKVLRCRDFGGSCRLHRDQKLSRGQSRRRAASRGRAHPLF